MLGLQPQAPAWNFPERSQIFGSDTQCRIYLVIAYLCAISKSSGKSESLSLHPDLTAPEWAPRLRQTDIRKLYEQDASGRVEDAAVNAIGTRLMARCESLLAADAAVRGKAECPKCRRVIEHDSRGDEQLVCSGCSWAGTWAAYRQSLKGQNLRLGNLSPVVEHFVGHFAHCGTARERLIQIDFLLHQFQSKGDHPGEVFATSLLEGKDEDVEQFLETLEYGEQSTPELSV